MKRWRVVARDVNGNEMNEVGRRMTVRGARRLRRKWSSTIPEPLPGRPLYHVVIERLR